MSWIVLISMQVIDGQPVKRKDDDIEILDRHDGIYHVVPPGKVIASGDGSFPYAKVQDGEDLFDRAAFDQLERRDRWEAYWDTIDELWQPFPRTWERSRKVYEEVHGVGG